MTAPARRARPLVWLSRENSAAPTLADYPRSPMAMSRAPGGPPLVSLVVPVLNGASTLRDCLDSAVSQDHPAIEIIVVDGGSTDGTLDIVREYGTAITRCVSERDRGIFDAMNKGIALATGDLIKLLNADDRLNPGSAAAAAAAHRREPDAVIRSDLEVIDLDGNVVKRMVDTTHPRAPETVSDLFVVLHPSWYVPRRVYEQHGLYDRARRVSGDYDYFCRLVASGVPFVHVDSPLIQFRVGGVSGGMRNIRERFEVTSRYLGRRVAIETSSVHAMRKLRSRLLVSVLGEKAFYALRKRIGWSA